MSKEIQDELIFKIMKAIYWKRITNKENAALVNILEDAELSNHDKAHCICEYLQIERRGNRSAIIEVLNQQNT